MDKDKLLSVLDNIKNLKDIIDGIYSSLESLNNPNNSYAPYLSIGDCKAYFVKELFQEEIKVFLNKSLDIALINLNENIKKSYTILIDLE